MSYVYEHQFCKSNKIFNGTRLVNSLVLCDAVNIHKQKHGKFC